MKPTSLKKGDKIVRTDRPAGLRPELTFDHREPARPHQPAKCWFTCLDYISDENPFGVCFLSDYEVSRHCRRVGGGQ